jgi:hypothetical protein
LEENVASVFRVGEYARLGKKLSRYREGKARIMAMGDPIETMALTRKSMSGGKSRMKK